MKGTGEMSPQLQNQIMQYQQVQQQLQAVTAQKMQIEAQVKEMDRSLEEIKGTDDKTPIYRMVGGLLIQAKDREGLAKEIGERKETMEIRLRALEKQEKHLRDRFMELHEQLSKIVGAQQGAQTAEDKDE
jgi:prefoldin beta subunit